MGSARTSVPKARASAARAPRAVREVIRRPGRALDPATRFTMERHFGYDFSNVRLHDDADAHRSARLLNALAYTVGNHIVLRAPEHLAHELAHVAQNRDRNFDPDSIKVAPPNDPREADAERAAHAIANGLPVPHQPQADSGFLRKREAPVKENPTGLDIENAVKDIVIQKTALPLSPIRTAHKAVAALFYQEEGIVLADWLALNVKDPEERVHSIALAVDGLEWPIHARLASHTLARVTLDFPSVLLGNVALEDRKLAAAAYRKTFGRVSPTSGNLAKDMLAVADTRTSEYQKSLMLLDHDLTAADTLFLLGCGRNASEVEKIIALLQDTWDGGLPAFQKLDADWNRYILGAWSDLILTNAAYKSLGDHTSSDFLNEHVIPYFYSGKNWNRVEPFFRQLAQARDQTSKAPPPANEYQALFRKIETVTEPILTLMRRSLKDGPEAAEKATNMLQSAWKKFFKEAAKAPKDVQDHLEALYQKDLRTAQQILQREFTGEGALEPLLVFHPTLADEIYASIWTGRSWYSSFFEAKNLPAALGLLTKAWAQGGSRLDEMLADARVEKKIGERVVRPAYSPATLFSDPPRIGWVEAKAGTAPKTNPVDPDGAEVKLILTLADATANPVRGFHYLLVALIPNEKLSQTLRRTRLDHNLSDTRLEPAYRFLSTPGVSTQLRNDVVRLFVENTEANLPEYAAISNGEKHYPRTFMRYILAVAEGARGDNAINLQDLIDPTANPFVAAKRAEARNRVGSEATAITRFARFLDALQGRDTETARRASVVAIRELGSKTLEQRQLDLYQAKDRAALLQRHTQLHDQEIAEFRATQRAIAASLQKATEWIVEAGLIVALGPAAWAAVAAAVAGKGAGLLAAESALGSAYELGSRENARDLVLAALGSLLVDKVNIRAKIAEAWNPETSGLLKFVTKHSDANTADFVGQMLQNGAAGAFDGVATAITTVLIDTQYRHQNLSSQSLDAAFNALWTGIVGKAALPLFGSRDINPQKLNDLVTPGFRLEIDLGFKTMLAVPSILKRIGEDAGKDDYFDFADFLVSTGAAFAQKAAGALFKGGASARAQQVLADRNVARVNLHYGAPGSAMRAASKAATEFEGLVAIAEYRKEFEAFLTRGLALPATAKPLASTTRLEAISRLPPATPLPRSIYVGDGAGAVAALGRQHFDAVQDTNYSRPLTPKLKPEPLPYPRPDRYDAIKTMKPDTPTKVTVAFTRPDNHRLLKELERSRLTPAMLKELAESNKAPQVLEALRKSGVSADLLEQGAEFIRHKRSTDFTGSVDKKVHKILLEAANVIEGNEISGVSFIRPQLLPPATTDMKQKAAADLAKGEYKHSHRAGTQSSQSRIRSVGMASPIDGRYRHDFRKGPERRSTAIGDLEWAEKKVTQSPDFARAYAARLRHYREIAAR